MLARQFKLHKRVIDPKVLLCCGFMGRHSLLSLNLEYYAHDDIYVKCCRRRQANMDSTAGSDPRNGRYGENGRYRTVFFDKKQQQDVNVGCDESEKSPHCANGMSASSLYIKHYISQRAPSWVVV